MTDILLDTNVLVRIADATSPSRSLAQDAVQSLVASGHEICIVPQVLYEFYVVATRSGAANGLELEASDALTWVETFDRRLVVLEDTAEVRLRWL